MKTKKAGTILLDLKSNKIGLVYRNTLNDFTFPKGHLEKGETLQECAVRETEEETLRANHLLLNKSIYILEYTTPSGEEVENYMYISVDDGETKKNIPLKDRENLKWFDIDEIESKLSYDNLKIFWSQIKPSIQKILESNGKCIC